MWRIARTTRETRGETGRAELSPAVMKAMGRVPRHRLVPATDQHNAYQNRPVAIGHGQTISQPFIVALMTDLLEVRAGDKILEVGTGSGYQAAVLADWCESSPSRSVSRWRAKPRPSCRLGFPRSSRRGGRFRGWPSEAPSIDIVTRPRRCRRRSWITQAVEISSSPSAERRRQTLS